MDIGKPIIIGMMRMMSMKEMQLEMMSMLHFLMQTTLNLSKSIIGGQKDEWN